MRKMPLRNTILTAAISILEKEGFHTFDLNKLSKKLHVDVEEIKKVFPDANILIQESLKQTIKAGLVENFEECVANYQNKYTFLKKLFYMTIIGALSHPKIVRSHFYTPFIIGKNQANIVKQLSIFIEKVWEVVKSEIKTEKREICRRRLNQAFAAILFAAIFPQTLTLNDPDTWSDDMAKYVAMA